MNTDLLDNIHISASTVVLQSMQSKPLLLTAGEAAVIFHKSERTWRTWDALGKTPRPVRVGRAMYWRPEELHAWIAAGCPPREEWENLTKVTAPVALPDSRRKPLMIRQN